MPIGRDPAERAALTRTHQVHKSGAWRAVALKVEQKGKGQRHGDPPTMCLCLDSFSLYPMILITLPWEMMLFPDGAAGTLQVPGAPLRALLTAQCL